MRRRASSTGRRGPGRVPAILWLLAAGWAGAASAANRYAVASGNWTSTGVWSSASCAGASGASVPANNDDVVICGGRTVTVDANTNNLRSLSVQAGAVLQGDGAGRALRGGRAADFSLLNDGTINFSGATAATIQLNRNSQWSGAGTWNLHDVSIGNRTLSFAAGSVITLNLSAPDPISHAPGAGSVVNPAAPAQITWNFNGTAAQTLPNRTQIQYGVIRVNNASATGVTLGVDLSAAAGNLNGSVLIENGTLSDGGFAMAGPASSLFRIFPGATFRVTGATNRVSGFGTIDYGTTGACGTVNYAGAAQAVAATPPDYGNLTLSGSGIKTLPATALTVACDFTLSGTASTAAAAPISVGRHFTLGGGTAFAAADFTHGVGGNFSNSGSFTAGTSTLQFNGTGAQSISGAATVFHHLLVGNSAAAITALTPFTVGGTLSIAAGANLADGGNAVTLRGDLVANGSHTGAGKLLLQGGAGAHSLSGPGTVTNLELDDAPGAALGSDFTVAGTLTLTGGILVAGTRTLITTRDCNAASVVRSAGYVEGRLQKRIPSGASVCVFETGSAGDYAPVEVSHGGGTVGGDLVAYTTAGDHPNIGTAALDPARSVNRYWTLAEPASGAAPAGGYSATFTFVPGNVDPGANPAVFEARRFTPALPAAGVWSAETVGLRTATTTRVTGLAALGDFALGEPGSTAFTREPEFIYTREVY
jgi:hypothetical protein